MGRHTDTHAARAICYRPTRPGTVPGPARWVERSIPFPLPFPPACPNLIMNLACLVLQQTAYPVPGLAARAESLKTDEGWGCG